MPRSTVMAHLYIEFSTHTYAKNGDHWLKVGNLIEQQFNTLYKHTQVVDKCALVFLEYKGEWFIAKKG